MKELNISYSTYQQLDTKIPFYHIRQGNGTYIAYAVSENYLIICNILTQIEVVDFENNFLSKSTSVASADDAIILGLLYNKTPLINPYQKDKAKLVAIVGREGSETIWATHNFCDKTTWYGDSERISEILSVVSDNGNLPPSYTKYSGSFANWIDMTHGKVFDEDALCKDVEHGYSIIVTVNNITQSMRPPFADSGGDYTVDYKNGVITFETATTGSVQASYSYENGSTWYFTPLNGKAIDIQEAEIQFTTNISMNDNILFAVYGNVEVFAPEYCTINGGPYLPGTKIKIDETKYKSMAQLTDEAKGSLPVIPSIAGTNGRGLNNQMYGLPFIYTTVRRLYNKYGMELRVSLENNISFSGERATATFYCTSRTENDLT